VASAEPKVRQNPLRSQTLIGISPPAAHASSTAANAAAAEPALAVEPDHAPAPGPVASIPTPEAAFARPAISEAPPSSTAATESQARPLASTAPTPREKRSGLGIVLLAAAGLALGVLGYCYQHRNQPPTDLAALPILPAAPAAASPSAPSAQIEPVHEPAASATAVDLQAALPAPVDAPAASAEPAASAVPAASAEPAASAAPALEQPAAGTQRITITTVPPKARFFHFGKQVGTAPFVIDLPAGEKRAYEVWLPKHITRKLLVDGSKTEISIGLREEPQ
jgi:hypothetical protein